VFFDELVCYFYIGFRFVLEFFFLLSVILNILTPFRVTVRDIILL